MEVRQNAHLLTFFEISSGVIFSSPRVIDLDISARHPGERPDRIAVTLFVLRRSALCARGNRMVILCDSPCIPDPSATTPSVAKT